MKHGDDPADYTVAEITEHYNQADPDEQARILEAERAGKDRTGVAVLAGEDDAMRDADEQAALNRPGARTTDAEGNVRPADARWLGDANDDKSPEELSEIREREVQRNRELAEQAAAEQRRKDEARRAEAEAGGES